MRIAVPLACLLLWTTRHDGLAPVIGGFTDVRVVCNNTLDAAMGSGLSNRFKIRHTASASERIAEAHRFLNRLMVNARNQSAEYQKMATTLFSVDQMKGFAEFQAYCLDLKHGYTRTYQPGDCSPYGVKNHG